jgi:autoinducer 2-degrading protein
MIVRIITVSVKPGQEAAFEEETCKNHRGTIEEPGALRFDVLKDSDTPGRYYLYEAYRSEEAAKAHKETAHYKEWKAAVADMMAEDRKSVSCEVIEPRDESRW